MKLLHQLVALPARDPHEPHRAATTLELLFDLVSVLAVASATATLHHAISEGHGLDVLPRFLFVFTAIWWAWLNFTWFASAFDNDGPVYRLLVMLIMTGELIFAGGASHIISTLDMQWGILGWCLMRVGMALLWLGASANTGFATTCRRYAAGILLAQAYWVLMYLVADPASPMFLALGMLGFVIEFAVPPIAESARVTPFHRHHIIERYGLFAIISLGEIMLSISLGFGKLYGEHAAVAPALTSLAAVVIVFALFWMYFCEKEHLPSSGFSTAFIWGYAHVFIYGAIAALGAGLAAAIDVADGHAEIASREVAGWLGVPLGIVMATLWLVRDRHFDLGWRAASLPVMAAVAVAGGWLGLPIWGFAILAVLASAWRVPLAAEGTIEGE